MSCARRQAPKFSNVEKVWKCREVQRSAESMVPTMCRPIDHTHACRSRETLEEKHRSLEDAWRSPTGYDQQNHQLSDHDQVYTPTKPTHRLGEDPTKSAHRLHTGEDPTKPTHRLHTGEDPTKPTHRLHTGEDTTKPTHRLSNKHHSGSASQNDKLHQKNPTQGKPDERQ